MTKLRRKLFVKWSHLKLSFCFMHRDRRERERMITQARHFNRLVAQRGHGVYRSVVLNGRRY